jgi:hypothetical protein
MHSPIWIPRPLVLITLFLACLVPAQARAGYVVNGGFETGDFTGWTRSGNLADTGVTTGIANSGSYAAFLGPAETLGFLSQQLATTVGTTYILNFYLQSDGLTPNEFQVTFGGMTFDHMDLNAFNYTQETFQLTATSSSTLLQFDFRNDNGDFFLDDVSVAAIVPEPSSIILSLQMSIVCLFFLAWKRRELARQFVSQIDFLRSRFAVSRPVSTRL